MPDSTRRFLAPLVGIDPASVSIYSDPTATRLAASADADAFAVGDVVALGAGQLSNATDPETLGLLAHELTHVARWREPRFIPPIARPAERDAPAGSEAAIPTDEEGIARTVEARVARAAGAARPSAPPPVPPLSDAPDTSASPAFLDRDAGDTALPVPPRLGNGPAGRMPSSRELPAATWNGLPAPWEPLPTWLAPADTVDTAVSAAPGPRAASPAPVAAAPAVAASAPAAAAPAVQFADRGRATDEAAPASEVGTAGPHQAASPEPDLDALARQVYAVLRRRLSAEGRRAP